MALKKTTYINTYINSFVIPSHIKGKKYYLYAHFRLDKQEPFYFGIGTLDRGKYYYRATDCIKRNIIWKRIHNKTIFNVLIIDESDVKKEMCDREISYIALMGKKSKKNGCLANITDGGEGLKGHSMIWTEEMKNKIRIANSKRVIKDSTRKKLSEALKKRGIINRKSGN